MSITEKCKFWKKYPHTWRLEKQLATIYDKYCAPDFVIGEKILKYWVKFCFHKAQTNGKLLGMVIVVTIITIFTRKLNTDVWKGPNNAFGNKQGIM